MFESVANDSGVIQSPSPSESSPPAAEPLVNADAALALIEGGMVYNDAGLLENRSTCLFSKVIMHYNNYII